MLGSSGQVAYVTDADGDDAIEIAYLPRASGDREPRRLASGRLGRVQEITSDPEGERLAVASNDGRLLLLDTTRGQAPDLAGLPDPADASDTSDTSDTSDPTQAPPAPPAAPAPPLRPPPSRTTCPPPSRTTWSPS